jgi:hypothetical protein
MSPNDKIRFNDPSTLVKPEARVCVSITEQDYDILLEGGGSLMERGWRDVSLGVFATSLVGAVGVLATVDLRIGDGLNWKPTLLVIGLFGLTLLSLVLTIFFWVRLASSGNRRSFTSLCDKIKAQFSEERE